MSSTSDMFCLRQSVAHHPSHHSRWILVTSFFLSFHFISFYSIDVIRVTHRSFRNIELSTHGVAAWKCIPISITITISPSRFRVSRYLVAKWVCSIISRKRAAVRVEKGFCAKKKENRNKPLEWNDQITLAGRLHLRKDIRVRSTTPRKWIDSELNTFRLRDFTSFDFAKIHPKSEMSPMITDQLGSVLCQLSFSSLLFCSLASAWFVSEWRQRDKSLNFTLEKDSFRKKHWQLATFTVTSLHLPFGSLSLSYGRASSWRHNTYPTDYCSLLAGTDRLPLHSVRFCLGARCASRTLFVTSHRMEHSIHFDLRRTTFDASSASRQSGNRLSCSYSEGDVSTAGHSSDQDAVRTGRRLYSLRLDGSEHSFLHRK